MNKSLLIITALVVSTSGAAASYLGARDITQKAKFSTITGMIPPAPLAAKPAPFKGVFDTPLSSTVMPVVESYSIPTTPVITDTLSLEEAVQKALSDSPDRKIAAFQSDEAKAGIREARSGYYPQVNAKVEGGREYNDPFAVREGATNSDGWNYGNNTSLNVRQMLFDGMLTRATVAQRLAATKAAGLNEEKISEQLIASTVETYMQLHYFQNILTAARRNLKALEEISGIVQLRQTAGESNATEKYYIEARKASARQDVANAEAASRDAFSALKFLIGETANFTARTPSLQPVSKNYSEQIETQLITEAEGQNTPLKQLREDIAGAKYDIRAARAKYYPTLSAVGDGNHAEDLGGETGISRAASARLELSMRLFDGGMRRAGIERSVAKLSGLEAREQRLLRELKQNVQQSYNKNITALTELENARSEITANTELASLYRTQFRHGDGDMDITRLVEAQERIFTAASKQAKLNSDAVVAHYELERLTGKLRGSFCGGGGC